MREPTSWSSVEILSLLAVLAACAACGSQEAAQESNDGAATSRVAAPMAGSAASGSAAMGVVSGAGSAPSASAVAAGAASGSTSADGSLPCDVAKVATERCQSCHAAQPLFGARMPLVTWADFQRPAVTDPTRKVYQLVAQRIADTSNPMPPATAGMLAASEIALLSSWSERGAPQAAASDADCATGGGPVGISSPATMAQAPATPAAEDVICYDLTTHNNSSPTDTAPFEIPTGESYHCFYFDTPWQTPTIGVAFRSKLDNDKALHHWFLYAMPSSTPNGTVETCLPLHIDGPKMLAGWAPGGKDMTLPDGVGAEIPAPGSTLMLEWHYFNNTSAPMLDKSSVSICTVPAGGRPNVAAITWVGTEDFGLGMPPGTQSAFTGSCTPSRAGLGANDPIQLLYTIPHMHQYGRHFTLEIARAGGDKLAIFDQAFSEANQAWVATPAQMNAGDKLLTTCTFQNTSDTTVAYGSPFGNGEMCYGFVWHYPAHALDNGSSSLLGASNACL